MRLEIVAIFAIVFVDCHTLLGYYNHVCETNARVSDTTPAGMWLHCLTRYKTTGRKQQGSRSPVGLAGQWATHAHKDNIGSHDHFSGVRKKPYIQLPTCFTVYRQESEVYTKNTTTPPYTTRQHVRNPA